MSGRVTDAELALMLTLWRRGPSTAREVVVALDDDRAYTTVSTLLRILAKKGFVEAVPEGRTHRYGPTLDRRTYEQRVLAHLVESLFDGDPEALVRRLRAPARSDPATEPED